jgi:ABC-2 type transport system permease protein
MVPLIIVLLITGTPLSWTFLLFPIPIIFLAMFSLGVGLLISTWAIYYYDVAEMYQIVLTAWMYLTPIIYPESIVPENIRLWLFTLNPMYHMVTLFRASVYDGTLPEFNLFLITGGISFLVMALGWIVFTQKSDEFAYRV